MKFSANSLKKLIKGACYFEESRGYLTSYKYSKKQIDLMNADGYDTFWCERGMFSAGIRLEFKTNAKTISFDYKATYLGDRSNTVDLYVNGVLFAIKYLCDTKGKMCFELPDGDKSITIYYPNDTRFSVKNFTIDGSYKAVKDKGQNVLVIGDSITQGYGPIFSSGSYFNTLQRKTGYNMLNQGIGGYRFEPDDLMLVDGFTPDKVMVFLGTNWYDAPNEYDYENATVDFYKRLVELYPDKEILAITPIWRNNDVDFERFHWCIDIIKRECAKHGNIKVVDGLTLVPNVDECFCDKCHPNEYGCELLAENLYKAMKKFKF